MCVCVWCLSVLQSVDVGSLYFQHEIQGLNWGPQLALRALPDAILLALDIFFPFLIICIGILPTHMSNYMVFSKETKKGPGVPWDWS